MPTHPLGGGHWESDNLPVERGEPNADSGAQKVFRLECLVGMPSAQRLG
jgi:hypothetical protein